jgi:acyl dehydratase
MFTMAHLARAVTEWLGDPGAMKGMQVQFRQVVYMDETLVARGRVTHLEPATRRATLDVWVELDRDGGRVMPIKNSVAEVELA